MYNYILYICYILLLLTNFTCKNNLFYLINFLNFLIINNKILLNNKLHFLFKIRLDGKRDEVDCASVSTAGLGSGEPPSGTTVQIVQNTGMI